MPWSGNPRRRTIALLAAGFLLVLAVQAALNAFNLPFLSPRTTGQILVFSALSVLVFLLLLLLLLLLLRNIVKLYADQQSRALGSRLRTRMVLGAALIAMAPAAFMFLFSYGLMNRSIDRWFTQPTYQLREDSLNVVEELARYASSNARVEAEAIAATEEVNAPQGQASLSRMESELHEHRITLAGGFAAVYSSDRSLVTSYELPSANTQVSVLSWMNGETQDPVHLEGTFPTALLIAAQRNDNTVLLAGGREYAVGLAATDSGRLVVVAQPMPPGLNAEASRIRRGATEYWRLFRSRNRIRTTFFLMLLLITALVFFSSVWLALFLSKQITRPVEALADAMDEIAAGKYKHRVTVQTGQEMSELVRSFNHMAADLETSRMRAESSAAQLSAANRAIEERRRELETILETIPNAVVTLDADGAVIHANRAFNIMAGQHPDATLTGRPVATLLPADCSEELTGLIRRSYRMGAASTEIDTQINSRQMHLAVTCARLDLRDSQQESRQGAVMVLENTTGLLRAQKQLAWKEVAQRVAHEIKNPLTPIALSAERIGRHLDRPATDSSAVIRKCSEVILSCVGTLRSLVDQFSALAEFPASRPRPCDINGIIEKALAMFSGRLKGIDVHMDLAPGLPQVVADPEAIQRALANLIDNAAEAMQGSLLHILQISSTLSEDCGSVEVAVADTGHGLTEEIRERLFLPFYSTKHRGTGLGLSIAAKIVQEHHGSIRAESNTPKGARFLLRLPLAEAQKESSEAPDSKVRAIS